MSHKPKRAQFVGCRTRHKRDKSTGHYDWRPAILTLGPFERGHEAVLASWFQTEADLVLWGGPDLHFPLSTTQIDEMRAPPRTCFSAHLDGQLAGHAQLRIDDKNGVARLGRVAIAPDHRGKGLSGALLHAVLHEAFDHLGMARVELYVYPQNTAALSAYRKAGFRQEGVLRKSALVEGTRWDTVIMGLLQTEWQAGKNERNKPL